MGRTPNIFFIIAAIIITLVIGIYWLYIGAGDLVPETKSPENNIVVRNCQTIVPPLLTVDEGDEVTFTNNDVTDHEIYIGGRRIKVPAQDDQKIKARFEDGAGTYAYDCDNAKNVAQISIVSTKPTVSENQSMVVVQTFKEFYDTLPVNSQECIKNALAGNFSKAYGNSEYRPTDEEAGSINSCFR